MILRIACHALRLEHDALPLYVETWHFRPVSAVRLLCSAQEEGPCSPAYSATYYESLLRAGVLDHA